MLQVIDLSYQIFRLNLIFEELVFLINYFKFFPLNGGVPLILFKFSKKKKKNLKIKQCIKKNS